MGNMDFSQFKKKTSKPKITPEELEGLDLDKIVQHAEEFEDLPIVPIITKKTTRKKSTKAMDPPSDNLSSGTDEISQRHEIHLEDLFISDEEIWSELSKKKSGALKNWFTKSHPKSDDCKRDSEVSEIAQAANKVISNKLREAKSQW